MYSVSAIWLTLTKLLMDNGHMHSHFNSQFLSLPAWSLHVKKKTYLW